MIVAGRDGWAEVAGGRVLAAGDGRPPRRASRRVDGVLRAGLVDLQVNGAAGVEVVGGAAALDRIDAAMLDHGVTSYLATVVSVEDEVSSRVAAEVAERVEDPASPVAGLHLEGPFISAAHRGAHRPEMLRPRFGGELPPAYLSPATRLVTLAPEMPGAFELIAALRARGVTVSLGHSGADVAMARAAVDAGARMVTHLFNAMGPLGHRAPGLAGVALTDPRVRVGLIADGVHVDPVMLRIVQRAAGRRVRLVSDAVAPAGAPPGEYALAGERVVSDGERALTDDGALAGGVVLLDEMTRRWARLTGTRSAFARPRAGSSADLIVLDDEETVRAVMRTGCWVR